MQVQNGADLFTVGAQFYAASLSDDLLVAVAPLMPPPPSPPPPAPQPPW